MQAYAHSAFYFYLKAKVREKITDLKRYVGPNSEESPDLPTLGISQGYYVARNLKETPTSSTLGVSCQGHNEAPNSEESPNLSTLGISRRIILLIGR